MSRHPRRALAFRRRRDRGLHVRMGDRGDSLGSARSGALARGRQRSTPLARDGPEFASRPQGSRLHPQHESGRVSVSRRLRGRERGGPHREAAGDDRAAAGSFDAIVARRPRHLFLGRAARKGGPARVPLSRRRRAVSRDVGRPLFPFPGGSARTRRGRPRRARARAQATAQHGALRWRRHVGSMGRRNGRQRRPLRRVGAASVAPAARASARCRLGSQQR